MNRISQNGKETYITSRWHPDMDVWVFADTLCQGYHVVASALKGRNDERQNFLTNENNKWFVAATI